MKRIALVAALALASGQLLAQQTYWTEQVTPPQVSGYHNIGISQEMAALGYDGIVLLDAAGKEVPYFTRTAPAERRESTITRYELRSNTARDSVNTVIVHNPGRLAVDRLYLLVKPAGVRKFVTVRGSNDARQWFSVRQRTELRGGAEDLSGGTPLEIIPVDFPSGDYEYYELRITNNTASPLDIAGVGRADSRYLPGTFELLPLGEPVIREEGSATILSFPGAEYPYLIARIEIDTDYPGHYKRSASVRDKQGYVGDRFTLSSLGENRFILPGNRPLRDFTINIANEDNPPLAVTAVRAYGIRHHLCAYLEEGGIYTVSTEADDKKSYDIAEFAAEIPEDLPVVGTTGLTRTEQAPEPEREPGFFERPIFLWGVIVAVGVLLLLVCLKAVKDMRKKQ